MRFLLFCTNFFKNEVKNWHISANEIFKASDAFILPYKYNAQISGIANNINQIAMRVNIRGYVGTDELDYLKNTINKFILEFLKKIYSRE